MAAGIGEALLAAGQELKGFSGKMREQAAAQTKAQQNRAVMEAANLVVYAQNPTEAQLQDAITKLSAIDSPIAREVVAAGRERLQTMGNEKRRTDMLTVPGRPRVDVSVAPDPIKMQPISLPGEPTDYGVDLNRLASNPPATPSTDEVVITPAPQRLRPTDLPPEQQINFASIPGGAPLLNTDRALRNDEEQAARTQQMQAANAAKAEQQAATEAADRNAVIGYARSVGYPDLASIERPGVSADTARQLVNSWVNRNVISAGQRASLAQGEQRIGLSVGEADAEAARITQIHVGNALAELAKARDKSSFIAARRRAVAEAEKDPTRDPYAVTRSAAMAVIQREIERLGRIWQPEVYNRVPSRTVPGVRILQKALRAAEADGNTQAAAEIRRQLITAGGR